MNDRPSFVALCIVLGAVLSFGIISGCNRLSPLELGECSIQGMYPIPNQPYGRAIFKCGDRFVSMIIPADQKR